MTSAGKHPRFVVRQAEPLNGGPPPELLVERPVTPNPLFFVRSHGSPPTLDRADFRLRIDGLIPHPVELTWEDLRRFERQEQVVTLQCAGNRRSELLRLGDIPDELVWEADAVSTARWSGIPLLAVLQAAGWGPRAPGAHIAFEGRDRIEKDGQPQVFGGSIPTADPQPLLAALLADTMNGEPLAHVHGGPLRVIVPGVIGARSVKWLRRITIQDTPSASYFQQQAYRLYTGNAAEDADAPMLHELPVNSAICIPHDGARVPAGPLLARGYALTGPQRLIQAVEVQLDDCPWQPAALLTPPAAGLWRLWEAGLVLTPGPHTLAVRALDSADAAQPERLQDVWNRKGYANNAVHRITIYAEETP